uniref:Uncharacterized protein n=1 Tax=Palpitomonas bilix TaxID=652834 RepID=A0A7S3GAH8_9EUKA|mmetsp:Transcript_35503/g.92519  ORF Transcript_35503/g.92519 Transcript_35503/m.92519 type:complete len:173 (+) Transcript_35503:213-731(+)
MAESFASTRSSLHDQREFKPRKHISKPGSVHAAKNYDFNQTAFEETDIPPHARAARTIVLDQIDPDHLALKKPRWNGSTYTAEKFPDRAMKRVISAGQSIPPPTNYRAEVVPTAELIPANVNEDRYLKSQKKAGDVALKRAHPAGRDEFHCDARHEHHPPLAGRKDGVEQLD